MDGAGGPNLNAGATGQVCKAAWFRFRLFFCYFSFGEAKENVIKCLQTSEKLQIDWWIDRYPDNSSQRLTHRNGYYQIDTGY
jgi:hypothetical protein